MTVYENLKRLEQIDLLKSSIRNGLISPIYLDYVNVFEKYKRQRLVSIPKMQIYSDLSHEYSVSETTIRKIVRLMQS